MNPKALIPVLLLLLVGTAVLLNGCKPKQEPNNPGNAAVVKYDDVTIYFSKSRGPQAVTEGVVRKQPEVASDQPEMIEDVRYAVEELLRGPNREESMEGFYSEIPKGTRLLDVSQENGLLNVNLSSQFTTGGGANSVTQRVEELTKTIFATLPAEQKVYVLVDGKPLDVISGEGLEIKQPLEQALQ